MNQRKQVTGQTRGGRKTDILSYCGVDVLKGKLITFKDDKGKFKNGFVEIPLIQFAVDKIKEILEESVKSDAPNEVFLKVIDKNEMLVEFRDTSKALSKNEVSRVINIVNNAVSTIFDNVAKFVQTKD